MQYLVLTFFLKVFSYDYGSNNSKFTHILAFYDYFEGGDKFTYVLAF